ncbi:hypothetical protein CCACVL1_15631, partial [Corchorus capsularis]
PTFNGLSLPQTSARTHKTRLRPPSDGGFWALSTAKIHLL